MNYEDWDDENYDSHPVKIKSNKPKNSYNKDNKKDNHRKQRQYKEKERERLKKEEGEI